MFRYVSKLVETRIRDTYNLGINVRKSFNVTQQQQKSHEENDPKLSYSVVPRHQDPSRDKDKSDEKFKKKYSRLNNNRCILNAWIWSTALITGFYTSQLVCLYRRNQRLAHGGSRCLYSKYLLNKTVSLHKNVKHLLTPENYLLPSLTNFGCPFKKASTSSEAKPSLNRQKRSIEDEFTDFKHFVDPGYQKFDNFERFFDRREKFSSRSNVYNVNNDGKNEVNVKKPQEGSLPKRDLTQDEAIDDAIQQLARIVGEYEFQLGIESVLAGHFEDAADHFKLSTNHNHPGGIFNLAICYEQGVGVKKSMRTARRLYEIASRLGHAKALYNLGVFSSQGLGGATKDSQQAKQYFEQAADLGNIEALQALKVFLPQPKKFKKIIEFPADDLFFTEKVISSAVAMNQNQLMRRVAVS